MLVYWCIVVLVYGCTGVWCDGVPVYQCLVYQCIGEWVYLCTLTFKMLGAEVKFNPRASSVVRCAGVLVFFGVPLRWCSVVHAAGVHACAQMCAHYARAESTGVLPRWCTGVLVYRCISVPVNGGCLYIFSC